jgi:hypothetical protein
MMLEYIGLEAVQLGPYGRLLDLCISRASTYMYKYCME